MPLRRRHPEIWVAPRHRPVAERHRPGGGRSRPLGGPPAGPFRGKSWVSDMEKLEFFTVYIEIVEVVFLFTSIHVGFWFMLQFNIEEILYCHKGSADNCKKWL